MAKDYTQAELIELGRKAAEAKEREAQKSKIRAQAVSQLITNHRAEFDKLMGK